MKKLFLSLTAFFFAVSFSFAQSSLADSLLTATKADGTAIQKYRRSSLYSVLIAHPTENFGPEIYSAFMEMPVPDKFNDHNLAIRSIDSSMDQMKKSGKKKDQTNNADITDFISKYDIAKALVSKWFDRNPSTGAFDIKLVQERGYYDASQADIDAAKQTERNISILGDAGEDLIGNTYMIVNDITFEDKGKNSESAARTISILGGIAGAFLGSSVSDLADMAAVATNQIDGFRVRATSYLFRLVWTKDLADEFYSQYWIDENSLNIEKKAAYENSNIFSLQYVGKTIADAENLSSKSFSKFTKEAQMLKVCARVVDKSILQLQRSYEEFKVKVPVYRVNDNKTVEVQIGLKEGVSSNSKYEVLMANQDADGHITYKRVGMIRPKKGYIWDNRFGALEEAQALEESGEKVKDSEAEGADAFLDATYFDILSGADAIMPGCLVREVEIK